MSVDPLQEFVDSPIALDALEAIRNGETVQRQLVLRLRAAGLVSTATNGENFHVNLNLKGRKVLERNLR